MPSLISSGNCQYLYLFSPPPSLFLLSGISFIPREVGEHKVSILKNGRHVPNSPITIMVVQSEIGDASLVKAHGDGLVQGTTFNNSSFVVDTREAGQCADLQTQQLCLIPRLSKLLFRLERTFTRMFSVKQ